MRLSKGFWAALIALFVCATAFAQGANASGTKKTAKAKPAAAASKANSKGEKKDAEKKDATGESSVDKQSGAAPTTAGPNATAGAEAHATPAATAANQPMDGSTYVVRLRDLEQRVDELKEQIRRSHTRLSLLSDTILSGGVGGARAEIKFTDDMSSAFRLTHALFVLDGAVQYNKQDDTGALASQKEIPIFSGSIPPGDHTLQVLLELHGYGYGVFSYLRGYRFQVKSSHSFTVTEGKTIQLNAIAWEKGGVTTPLEQRPAVRYVENITAGITTSGSQPSATGSASAGISGHFSIGAGGH
jgi:hypothetical protein